MTTTEAQKFLQGTLNAIKRHLGNVDFTVEELSRELGLNRMQLHRHLRRLGQPATGELLRNVRLEHGAEGIEQRAWSMERWGKELLRPLLQALRPQSEKNLRVTYAILMRNERGYT